ncbi:hypothetical protein ATI61_112253 [Archangium gephyra]|uniref:Uncharacterized protein n=1 Tax=Archangium gephyra TaxID=48 RepID=A0AAC8Q4K1_9BACT|nr:hypothetical protein [Archangium gephyra]AKJ00994.1 Hypothetical protein AA314_02620 [Archangium gephyra]REG26158.1 hypothetical protein ATI61_112253 [Archangium gephyra]
MKQIFRDEYFTILVDERQAIVQTIRTGKPFASMRDVEVSFAGLIKALDDLGRARYALLADIRAAPGRNDPQFEEALQRVRLKWISGFRKVGVFVQSAVGVLQVKRYARQDGVKRLVTSDEDELMRYLTEVD